MKPVLPPPDFLSEVSDTRCPACDAHLMYQSPAHIGYSTQTAQSINDAAYEAGMRDAVPQGWKVVPVEPTREMRNAAIFEQELHRSAGLGLYGDEPASTIYKAMLSASPELKK